MGRRPPTRQARFERGPGPCMQMRVGTWSCHHSRGGSVHHQRGPSGKSVQVPLPLNETLEPRSSVLVPPTTNHQPSSLRLSFFVDHSSLLTPSRPFHSNCHRQPALCSPSLSVIIYFPWTDNVPPRFTTHRVWICAAGSPNNSPHQPPCI